MSRTWLGWNVLFAAITAIGCSGADEKSDADYRSEVTTGMRQALALEIADWKKAAIDLAEAAPTPPGRGWDPAKDAQAITGMKEAWKRVRLAYEHIEGAIAPLFREIDFSVDARYEDFLAELKGMGDENPFDGDGVIGQHAIERILYSDSIPSYVVEGERNLVGYRPAGLPATEQEAIEFKTKLCARLVTDIATIEGEWLPARIDLGGAYQGLVSLMNEQGEKVNKAATQEEESRYAQRTLADLHANLEGTIRIYDLFRPWILTKNGGDPANNGTQTDAGIRAGFEKLRIAYDGTAGDAIPQPPPGWSSIEPTASDLQSPFGKLFVAVQNAIDPERADSVVSQMNHSSELLGFPVAAP